MKLLLLGTTGYHPNDRRHTACLMIPELGVVFDAGTAMYRVSDYLTTNTLDIFLTHAHLDHVIGLTYLFNVLEIHPLQQVTVHAEQEKLDALRTHLFSELLFPVMPPFHMNRSSRRSYWLLNYGLLLHNRPTHLRPIEVC